MGGEYRPIPANAASIWTDGENLYLGFPSDTAEPHTVTLPLDKCVPDTGMTGLPKAHHRGFSVLIETLKQRMIAGQRRPNIGEPGALPRDAIMKAVESDEKYIAWGKALQLDRKRKKDEKEEALAFLEELGL